LFQLLLTLWNENASEFGHNDFFPCAVRNGILSQYLGQKFINTTPASLFWQHPSLTEANDLMKWFQRRQKEAARD